MKWIYSWALIVKKTVYLVGIQITPFVNLQKLCSKKNNKLILFFSNTNIESPIKNYCSESVMILHEAIEEAVKKEQQLHAN